MTVGQSSVQYTTILKRSYLKPIFRIALVLTVRDLELWAYNIFVLLSKDMLLFSFYTSPSS